MRSRVTLEYLCRAGGLFAILCSAVFAEQEKIPLSQVPTAVIDAVKARFPKGELTGAEKETDGKTVTFEVKLLDKKRKFEVVATPEGKVLAVEKVLEPAELPKAVVATLDAKYARSKIKKAEEVSKGDQITFEVILITPDSETVKLVFDAKGKLLEPKS